MSQSNYTAAEILENHLLLMDVELLLKPFMGSLYDDNDSCDTQTVGEALARDARRKLLIVCEWLEEMHIEAEKQEASKLTGERSGGCA